MTEVANKTKNNRLKKDILFSMTATAVTIAATIVNFTNPQLGRFGLIVLAALPWAPMYWWRSRPRYQYVLAGALSVTLVASAVYIHTTLGRAAVPAAAPTPASAAAKNLKFTPFGGRIPHCVSFSGVGTVPAGYSLVLFDRPTDTDDHYTVDSTFSFDDIAKASGDRWSANEQDIGSGTPDDLDNHIAMVTILIPQRIAHVLAEIVDHSDSGQLPPDVATLGVETDQLIVIRNDDNKHC
jgi:hypothetical protein